MSFPALFASTINRVINSVPSGFIVSDKMETIPESSARTAAARVRCDLCSFDWVVKNREIQLISSLLVFVDESLFHSLSPFRFFCLRL